MIRWITAALRALLAGGPGNLGAGMEKLETLDDLEACLAQSDAAPVLIFKHSTRCPVSTAAMREMQAYVQSDGENQLPVYLNLVVESRPVSNAIAETLGIRHESPQLLLVSGRAATWHTSHGSIRADRVRQATAGPR